MGLADLLGNALQGIDEAREKYPEILEDLPTGVSMRETAEYFGGFCTQYMFMRELPSELAREIPNKIMVGLIRDARKAENPYADKMQALYNKALFDEPQE